MLPRVVNMESANQDNFRRGFVESVTIWEGFAAVIEMLKK